VRGEPLRGVQYKSVLGDMGNSNTKKLSKEDMTFLIENTNFTRPQIKAWYKGFMVRYLLVFLH